MEESGFPDFAIEGWYGIFAPAKTPKADRRQAVGRHQQGAEGARRRWRSGRRWASIPSARTPEAFAERQKADLAYWKKMIDYTGIKVE